MPTTDRPAAPLIPATPALLQDWCGPVIIEGAPCWSPWDGIDGEAAWRDDREDWQEADLYASADDDHHGAALVGVTTAGEVRSILLDLRRPEVQDRVARALFGTPCVQVRGRALMVAGWANAVGDAEVARAFSCRHVPALADLPEEHRVAWALWECWRAMEEDHG